MVDGYKFRMRTKEGYIAYFKGPTGIFVIKSFHKDDDAVTQGLFDNFDISKIKLSKGEKDE